VDKESIYQVFVNLMDNAVKYTQKGSVSINVEKNEDAQEVKVTIEDSGIGISQEFLDKMFEPFTQEDRGYSRRYEGNGLGLSLVKKYCELNGITIQVKSKKGIGTKFELIFSSIE
jgi:signal transduction histidine kinase